MAELALQLLGSFRGQTGDGRELALPTRKAWALLSYLALNRDQAISREKLATLLWGERSEEQARGSLRQTLYELRTALGDDFSDRLNSTRTTVTLSGLDLTVDALELERLAASEILDDIVAAANLYRGAFLDGLDLGETGFDTWVEGERARLREVACQCLQQLVTERLQRGESAEGLQVARRLVAIDSLQEPARRLLMEALWQSGRRNEALRSYQDLTELLQAELGVVPDAETQALRDRIALEAGSGDSYESRSFAPSLLSTSRSESAQPKRNWRLLVTAVALPLILATGLYLWKPWAPSESAASVERMAYPLPDRPSLAVMPFENFSANPADGHIAKGFTEDLITALSQLPQLFVISRTSSFALEDGGLTATQIAEQLGVRYIVEGSVQRSGERLRITAQLVDALRGHHLWADNFEGATEGLFAFHDDIVRRIVIDLDVELTSGDHARVASRGTRNLEAWLLRQQAMAELYKFTREGTTRTRELLQAAHRADPDWARPLGGLAWAYWYEARKGWTDDREAWIERGMALAEEAIRKDPRDTIGYMQLGNLYQLAGDHQRAIELREKAVTIAPNDFQANWGLGTVLYRAGQVERAIQVFRHAERVSPRHPVSFDWGFAQAQLLAGHYDDAIETASRAIARNPKRDLPYVQLVAAYSGLGLTAEAEQAGRELLETHPEFTVSKFIDGLPDYKDRIVLTRLAELLRQIGLPE